MARLDHPITAPPDLGPLGPVLEAAGAVNAGDRPDAMSLARALDEAAARLPPPAPVPLAAPVEDVERDISPTDYPGRPRLFDAELADREHGTGFVRPAGRSSPPDSNGEMVAGGPGTSGDGPAGGGARFAPGPPRLIAPDAANPNPVPGTVGIAAARASRTDQAGFRTPSARGGGRRPTRADGRQPTRGDGRQPTRRAHRSWARRTALAAVLVLLAGAAAVGVLVASGTFTPSHPVPNLVGLSPASAQQRLRPLHLHLAVSGRVYNARAVAGTVLAQHPATGRLREGASVAVTVSLGPQPVPVPKVVGLDADAATALVTYVGLRASVVGHAPSMTVPAGAVSSSTPAQGTLLPGQTVSLVVSTGKPTVPIPSLVGPSDASYAAAAAALAAAQLTATETQQYSDTVAAGSVIGTTPAAGTALTVGSQVTVVVSRGPHLVAVPNVAGDSVGAASQALGYDGFQVSGVTGNPIATVTGTIPASGLLARFGSAVQIVTG